jgi:hypothetical protein
VFTIEVIHALRTSFKDATRVAIVGIVLQSVIHFVIHCFTVRIDKVRRFYSRCPTQYVLRVSIVICLRSRNTTIVVDVYYVYPHAVRSLRDRQPDKHSRHNLAASSTMYNGSESSLNGRFTPPTPGASASSNDGTSVFSRSPNSRSFSLRKT